MAGTPVKFTFTRPDASGAQIPATAQIVAVATMLRELQGNPDSLIVPAPVTVTTPATGTVTLNLAPTTEQWVWRLEITVTGVDEWTEYVTVPVSATTVDYPDLVKVDPVSFRDLDNADPIWWGALRNGLKSANPGPRGEKGDKGDKGDRGEPGLTIMNPTLVGPAGPPTTDAAQLLTGTVHEARLPVRLSVASLNAAYAPASAGASATNNATELTSVAATKWEDS